MDFEFSVDSNGKPIIKTPLSGYALIANPLLNKGMAFSREEREKFNLWGLLPPTEATLKIQCERSYQAFKSKATDLEKYIYLRDLQNSNETLFYKVLTDHITEMMPIVYTPTVGLGCQQFSLIYRRPRGIFISYPDKDRIYKILSDHRLDKVKAIVVSDGERILGLGDQGAGGMGIPIGKLSLYTACAGIHPANTLPILLDTGTDNEALLKDPLYIGWHHERIRGKKYQAFVDEFINVIKKRFSHVLLQWEDFAQQNANPLLERYRHEICTFNDDIQGTAAVAAGTLFSAIHVTKIPLHQQRIVVVGAGSAGCGISRLILQAMLESGMSSLDAHHCFYLVDQSGLLLDTSPQLLDFQKPFAQPKARIQQWSLEHPAHISLKDVVKNVHPTLLIGVSGQGQLFTENIVREMAAHVERPIIFPLSNPTERAEANPKDLMLWTNDRAIIGTGSPFPEIQRNGKPYRVDQTNNSYIFPGLGLGIIAVQAKFVSDKMFMAAAKALAECSPAKKNPKDNLLPPLTRIREVSLKVAIAVAKSAIDEGLADFPDGEKLETHIRRFMWEPDYLPYYKI